MSPLEIFSGAKIDSSWITRSRVFGSPSYVLDPKVQDGKKLPRWSPKSRRGQFLGRSNHHASDIGLIRTLRTGYMSTQYHVVYDDFYTTVSAEGNKPPLTWEALCSTSRENLINANKFSMPPSLDKSWMEQEESDQLALRRRVQNRIRPRTFSNEVLQRQTVTTERAELTGEVDSETSQAV